MSVGTTYFAGNDFSSWTARGSVSVNTGGGYRSGWVSSAMAVTNTAVADPPPDGITSPVFTSISSGWFHGIATCGNSGIGSNNGAALLRVLDSSGVARIVVQGTGTTGGLAVYKENAALSKTLLFTATGTPFVSTPNAQNFIDLRVVYGTSGSVALSVNAVEVGSYSGDVTTDSNTSVAQLDLCSIAGQINWSEVLVSDSLTINAGVWALEPQATGNTQNWIGVVGDIDKLTVNDTTFIADGGTGDLSGWTTPTSPPSGAWLVQSIVQEARAAVGLSGPQHFDWYVRTADGSDHNPGVDNAPMTSFSNFPNYIWATNPHTSAAWAITDITTGFNLGVKSLA